MLESERPKNMSLNTDEKISAQLSNVSVTLVGVRGAAKRFGIKTANETMHKASNQRIQRKFRWKMLARVIVSFVRWEKLRTSGKDRGFVMRRMVAGRVQERVFNVAQFSKFVQQHQILSIHAKLLVYKEPPCRSSHDLVVILGYMNRMHCFNKYSVYSKRQLASRIRYSCFPENTVIFREGAAPTYFYFLLSGSVQLYKKVLLEGPKESPEEKMTVVEKALGKPIIEGNSFGDLSIANNTTRSHTVKTCEPCEFFTLEANDFIELLGKYHDEERMMKSNVIRNIPQVESVSEADIKKAIDTSYIKCFHKGDVIIRGEEYCIDGNDLNELGSAQIDTYAHVVVSGSAVLEKQIYVSQEPLPGGTTIVKLPEQSMRDKTLETVTQKVRSMPTKIDHQPIQLQGLFTAHVPPSESPTLKYLSVQTYIPGDLFLPFVHEKDYMIIAKEATTILHVPKTPFMLHKSGEVMVKHFDELLNSKISVVEQLKDYNSQRIWTDYRRQLVRQVLVDKWLRKSRC